MIVMQGDAKLLQIISALRAAGGFAAAWTAGSKRAIKMLIIAMTTSNSIIVNAGRIGSGVLGLASGVKGRGSV